MNHPPLIPAYIMATDGGPHPPDMWAHVSAQQIMQLIVFEPSASFSSYRAYRDLELKLFDAMVKFHGAMQETERELLKKSHERLHVPLQPLAKRSAEIALQDVISASRGTPFEAHFAENKDAQDHVLRILGQHFLDSLHIERCWHADRNPDNEHVRAFQARRHGL